MGTPAKLVWLLLVAGVILAQAVPPAGAQDPGNPRVSDRVRYRGPSALDDPKDPLQGVTWTLGVTIPPRNRLTVTRNQQLAATSFDMDRDRVLYSYRPGEEDILPPQALTPEQYAGRAFERGLREEWIQGNRVVIQESLTRPERGGLVNLSLPFQIPFTEKIFGEGAPNLRVTGSEQVTISGASSWVVGQVTGERGGASLFPKLDMRQRLNVNLQGTIGSKLFVDVAQNSDALTPLENSIKIRYRGDEDDVIQNVELGNTNLSLPPTQFVSYSARQEGLFGVKTDASVGNLDLTMIASRQQGQNGQATFRGGAEEQVVRINDLQYVRGRYFLLADPDSARAPNIVNIRVYLDDRVAFNDVELGAQLASAWIDPAQRTPVGKPYIGSFHLLREDDDYQLLNTGSSTSGDTRTRSLPILQLTNPLSPTHVLAVAYREVVNGDTVDVGTFQELAPGDTLQLKMIRPGENDWGTDDRNNVAFSTWAPVRRLELKNVYDLRARNIEKDKFELRIVEDVAGEGGDNPDVLRKDGGGVTPPLLQILGLDQKNNANPSNRTPDGLVDPEYIDYENGLLFFPDLRPFDPSLADIEGTPYRKRSWPVPEDASRPYILGWTLQDGQVVPSGADVRSRETVPEIYDLLPTTLDKDGNDYHTYTIEATVQSSASEIQLKTVGQVLTGSETVRLNGRVLERGKDYSIFYDTGTITLKNPEATAPGADLVVTYSYDSPFTRGAQSLVGGSLSTHPDPNAKLSLSTSWLHESRGTPDRRPRLGQEPTVTTVGDVAARLKLEPWALTNLVDKIPLVSTDAPSRFEMSSAVGISLPNPNTRNVVFMDDMEGVELSEGPSVDRSSWFYTSAPLRNVQYLDTPGVPFIVRRPDPTHRGQMLWFSPNTVKVADITPREDSQTTRDNTVSVLEAIYIPQDGLDPYESWGGLVSPISTSGADVSDYQYVEIWINDYVNYRQADQRRGEVLIDVGTVDEDAVWDPLTPPNPPNGILDVEDKNRSGGQIEYNEDVGLDGLTDDKESPRPGTKRMTPFSATEDPAGDKRVPEIQTHLPERTPAERIAKYEGIDGTEDNKMADGEDLNGDYFLDRANDYVEYRVDLSKPALIDVGRDYGVTDARNGWRLYRIPLDEFHLSEGIPNLSQVRDMRLWFTGVPSGDTLDVQVASVEIVGNRWEASPDVNLAPDEVFNVAVVNNKETAGYVEPFGVERVNGVKEKEQSISLDFENFRSGKELSAFKRLPSIQDYTLYQTLAFYLNPQFQDIPNDSVEFYIRFGCDASQDTLSYYEVSTDISQGDLRRRADGWIDLRMQVADLSGIKNPALAGILPDSFQVGPGDVVGGETAAPRVQIGDGLRVTVRGDPSFSRIRRISIGLRNRSGFDLSKGSVWFDELRMGEVRRDPGWAGRWAANVQLADLANIQASLDLTSADFLRLGQTRGSGTQDLRYDLRGQIGLQKFVEGAHLNAPLTVRYIRSRQTPKFQPNSDILYTSKNYHAVIPGSLERGVTLDVSRQLRGRSNPLARYTIDPLRLRGAYSEQYRAQVTRLDSTTNLNGGLSYSLNLNTLRPFRFLHRFQLSPWPQSVGIDLAGSRTEVKTYTSDRADLNKFTQSNHAVTRTGILNLNVSTQPISGLSYSWRSSRDLIDEHFGPDSSIVQLRRPADRFMGINLGREITQNHALTFGYTPPYLGRTLKPRFNWTSGSSKNQAPSLTLEDYKDVVFDISNNNNATVSMSFPLGRIVGMLTGTGSADSQRRVNARADTSDSGGGGDLRKLFTRIIRPKDIQASASMGRGSSYSRINGSPPLAYVLGLSRDIGLGNHVYTVEGAPMNTSLSKNIGFRGNTSFTVFRQINVDLEYNKQKDRRKGNDLPTSIKDRTTWPELRFNWGEIHKHLPLLPKLFTDFRIVNTTFSRMTDISGTELEPQQNKSVTSRWNPLLSIQGTLLGGWRTIVNANLSSTHGEYRPLGGAKTTNDQSSVSYQLSLARKFHREGSGVGRDIDFKTDIAYTTTTSVNRSSYSSLASENKEQNIRINTSAGVRLTRAMTGTFGLELSQNRRPNTNWTRRTVRVFFSTGFSF